MPRIPTAKRQVRDQLAPKMRATEKVSKDAFQTSSLPGKALELAGKVMYEEQKKAEGLEFDSLKTKLRAEKDRIYFDKDTGYVTQKGKNSAESFKSYQDQYKSYVDQQMSSIASEAVREKFKQFSDSTGVELSGQMNRHSFNEMQRHDKDETAAMLSRSKDSAIKNYMEMGLPDKDGKVQSKISEIINDQDAIIEAHGQRQGLSKDMIEKMKLDAKSETHEGVITRFLNNGHDMDGKEYFEQAKKMGSLNANSIARLERLTKVSSTKGESQRLADQIMNIDGISQRDAVKMAREKAGDNADLRDMLVSRVKKRHAENKDFEFEDNENKFNSAIKTFEETMSTDNLSPEQMSQLPVKRQKLLREIEVLQAKGHKIVDDPVVYEDLMLMAANPVTRNKFLRTSINDHYTKLSTASRKKLIDMQRSFKAKDGKFDAEARGHLSDVALVKNRLNEVGVTNDKHVARFNYMLNQEAANWAERHGKKKMPQKEFGELIDKLLNPVIVKNKGFLGLFDKEMKLFQVAKDDTLIIPDEDLKEIMDEANRKNVALTEDQAMEIYKQHHN